MYQRKNYKMFYIQVVISLWCVPISWNMNNSYKLLTYLLRNELHTRKTIERINNFLFWGIKFSHVPLNNILHFSIIWIFFVWSIIVFRCLDYISLMAIYVWEFFWACVTLLSRFPYNSFLISIPFKFSLVTSTLCILMQPDMWHTFIILQTYISFIRRIIFAKEYFSEIQKEKTQHFFQIP